MSASRRVSDKDRVPEPTPYDRVAASNGLIAVSDGGGRHPRVTCFAQEESGEIQPYQKRVQRQVWRSTACRDNRIIAKHYEMTEKGGTAVSEEDELNCAYGPLGQSSPRKTSEPKVSSRLYQSPLHLVRNSPSRVRRLQHEHFCARSKKSINVVGPNWGEDETFALLAIMDDRERYRN